MRTLVKNLMLFAMLGLMLGVLVDRFPGLAKGTDFTEFYVAGKMVRQGAGRQIYSVAAQQQFQARDTGRVGVYFNHPPFEALLYLPLAWSSLARAYLFWSLVNLALLAAVAWVLRRQVLTSLDWQALLGVFLLFAPVLLNFLQGQDSVLLLFCLTLAFAALKQEKEFSAGCLLACGMFKFHLVLPLLVVLLVGRGKKLLAGFSLAGFCLLLISAAISGWNFLIAYPRFLMQLRTLPLAGIHPLEMANLRGLTAKLMPLGSDWVFALTVAASLFVLGIAIFGWKVSGEAWGPPKDLAFANAVTGAVLVGYHLSPHDLTILLLPLVLIARHLLASHAMPKWLWASFVGGGMILFLPPLHVFLLERHQYDYAALPVLLLFVLTFAEIRRSGLCLRNQSLQNRALPNR